MIDSAQTAPDPGEPVYVGPCAACAGDAATAAVRDALDNLTGDRSFPAESIAAFRDRFGPTWNDMEEWLSDTARAEAMKQDHEFCYEHRPTKDDDE